MASRGLDQLRFEHGETVLSPQVYHLSSSPKQALVPDSVTSCSTVGVHVEASVG